MAKKKVVKKKEIKSKLSKKGSEPLTPPNFRLPKTFGQKASDKLTQGAGSWTFIICFFIVIGLWMSANVLMWVNEWDPYPFILLNLVLSCLAAIQAPIILMSQNRQAQRDRAKAAFDYRINKRAEEEIREIKRLLIRWVNK